MGTRSVARVGLALALLLGACSEVRSVETRTQLTLRIQANDSALLAQITHLRIALWRQEARWVPASAITIARDRIAFPLDVPIYPSNEAAIDKPFEVVVDALADGVRVSQSRVITAYARDTLRTLPLALYPCAHAADGACSPDGCHGDTCLTCAPGDKCDAVRVADPAQLELSEPDAGMLETPDGAMLTTPDGAVPGPIFHPEAGTPTEAGVQPSTICQKSSEICDAVDNDCDGQSDNGPGLSCIRDERAACTYTSGACSVAGLRQCSSICGWGACLPSAESACDRKDDDCDGYVDEGLLAVRTGLALAGFDGTLSTLGLAVSPVSSAAAGGYLAIYATELDDKGQLLALRLGPDAKPIGTPILVSADCGRNAAVAWNGSAWSVLYTPVRGTHGRGASVSAVSIDPSTGALGTACVLSAAREASEVVIAGTKPPIAVWNDCNGVYAANLASGAPAVGVLGLSNGLVSVDGLAFSVVEDGKEWALWAGASRNWQGNVTYPIHYLSLDASLHVLLDTVVFDSSVGIWPSTMVYLPATQRFVGHWYQDGMSHVVGHARNGSGLTKSVSPLLGTMLADDSGYAEITSDNFSRYAVSGEKFDGYDSGPDRFGDSDFSVAATRPASDTAGRYTILAGYNGALRLFSLGCK